MIVEDQGMAEDSPEQLHSRPTAMLDGAPMGSKPDCPKDISNRKCVPKENAVPIDSRQFARTP